MWKIMMMTMTMGKMIAKERLTTHRMQVTPNGFYNDMFQLFFLSHCMSFIFIVFKMSLIQRNDQFRFQL